MSSPCMCGSMFGGSAVLAYVRVPPCGWAPAPQGNASASPAAPVRKSRRPRRPWRASFMADPPDTPRDRSEEHTSELQSRENLVCRLLLEKKKKQHTQTTT